MSSGTAYKLRAAHRKVLQQFPDAFASVQIAALMNAFQGMPELEAYHLVIQWIDENPGSGLVQLSAEQVRKLLLDLIEQHAVPHPVSKALMLPVEELRKYFTEHGINMFPKTVEVY